MNIPVSTAVFDFPKGKLADQNVVQMRAQQVRTIVSSLDREWRPVVLQKLEELVRLPTGWDGYVAPPVSFATAEFALRMLDAVCASDCACPQIVPGSGGDLQIEWHTESSSIELHVKAPNDVFAWRNSVGTPEQELNLTNDFVAIVEWLRSLSRGDRASSTAAV